MDVIWIKLERKRRLKEQVWVVRGLENATKLVVNAQPCLGGGRALFGVHRTPKIKKTTALALCFASDLLQRNMARLNAGHPRAVHRHPLQCAQISSDTLSYFGHNS